jgi:CelD/BcsL family acetyltransferase involved in cellulose biosynthesis
VFEHAEGSGARAPGMFARAPHDLGLRVVVNPGELALMRGEWDEAVAADPTPNIYLTWEWVSTWWDHFGAGKELHVLVVRDAEGIVAIAPLQRARIGFGRLAIQVLQRISPEAGDYGGIVLVRRQQEAVDVILDHLERAVRDRWVAMALISRLSDDDPFLRLLRSALERRSAALAAAEDELRGACPFTDVREGFDLTAQAKKHQVGRRRRRLAEQHDDIVFTYHSGESLDAGFDRLLELHARRWAGRESEIQGLLAEPDRSAFLLDAVRALDGRGWVRLLTLSADGRPVAAELDFAYRRRMFMFKGAFDPAFGSFAPGQLLFHRMIEDALASGVEIVDWGRGDELYKRQWANGERNQVTITVTRSGLPGRLDAQRLHAARALDRPSRRRQRRHRRR